MEKISWTELRKEIATRINTDEKEVATFLNALIPSITKALQEDRQVRITNFGIFKLQSIAPRKSVNVSTGETFTLPGYDKLTFAPESSIRELIGNLSASNIEEEQNTAVADESVPLRKLSEQASEIVDILNDLGQSPDSPAKTDSAPIADRQSTDSQPTVATTLSEPETPEQAPEPKNEPIYIPTPTPEMEKEKEEPKEKKSRTWLIVGITVLIFALLLAAAFLFLGNRFVTWVDSLHNNGTQVEQLDQVPEEPIIVGDTIAEEGLQTQSTLPYPIEYNQFIAKERLPRGSRLAWLARKYYGERELWVFIYEANQKVIEHPSLIPVGTLIRIPKLPDALMDYNNPEVKELVDRLAIEYKKR